MVIISKTTISDYGKAFPTAAEPLNNWYEISQKKKNFTEIKNSVNSVDAVGNSRYCFKIQGNHFRLIVLILFKARTIFVLWFGTHAEYDKMNKYIGAKNIEFIK